MPKAKSDPKALKVELTPHVGFVPWEGGVYIQFFADENNTQPTFKFGKRKAQSILSALEKHGPDKFKQFLKKVTEYKKEE